MPRLKVRTGSNERASRPTRSRASSTRRRASEQAVEVGVELQVLARRQVEVDQRVVAEVADLGARPAGAPRAGGGRRRRACPRRAAAGWRACAAACSCRPRSGPARPGTRRPRASTSTPVDRPPVAEALHEAGRPHELRRPLQRHLEQGEDQEDHRQQPVRLREGHRHAASCRAGRRSCSRRPAPRRRPPRPPCRRRPRRRRRRRRPAAPRAAACRPRVTHRARAGPKRAGIEWMPVGAVEVQVEQRVDDVEARDPAGDRQAQQDRAPAPRSPVTASHAPDRRQADREPERDVADPGVALGEGVDHERRHRDRPEHPRLAAAAARRPAAARPG